MPVIRRALTGLGIAAVFALAGCGGSAAPRGDANAGKRVFRSAGCGSCHTLKEAGTHGVVGGPLDGASLSFDAVRGRVAAGGGGMPAFEGTLSSRQLDDVAAFVSAASQR